VIGERGYSSSHEVSLAEVIFSGRTKKMKLMQGVDGKRNTVHPEIRKALDFTGLKMRKNLDKNHVNGG